MINWTERAKAALAQTGQGGTAKTDETAIYRLLAVSSVATMAVYASSERLSSVLAVPSPAVLEKHDYFIAVTEDSDRWCWPNSPAMNGREIDLFSIRLEQFRSLGVDLDSAEKLSDRLVIRDRDLDNRIVCFECHFLRTGWHCMNSQNAGVCLQYTNSKLPNDFVHQLQRCSGFKSEIGEVNGHR